MAIRINKQELASTIRNLQELTDEQKSALLELLHEKKQYGLVWEEKEEDAQERLREELPVFVEDESKRIINSDDAPNHVIIEGDNLHALTALTYSHEGKFDAIYIDPPYNTGAKNWVYNNDYVDGLDSFKHSKWLSMMSHRLNIAKRLLSSSGILVLTIDDYEIENITLLCNEIFGEYNHLGTVVIKNNPQGRSSVTGFQISHEYALFYGTSNSVLGRLPRTDEQIKRYKEKDELGPFEWRNFRAQYSTESPKMVYPIIVDNNGEYFRIPDIEWNSLKKEYFINEKPGENEHVVWPIDETGRMRTWKWSIETVLEVYKTEMGVRKDRSGDFTVYYKGRMKDIDMLPYTIWDNPLYSASTFGANILAEIIGKKKFDYPKSLFAVIDSLKVANANKNSIILDFFAGSGTTLHATMQLNAEDGGHRQCILVTNNENNICEEVTYERNKRVINGYTKPNGDFVEGLHDNNLRYYKTEFVSRENSSANRKALMSMTTDLLCIKENLYDEVPFEIDGKKMKPQFVRCFESDDKTMIIIYDPRAVDVIAKSLPEKDVKQRLIYVYSDGQYAYNDEFKGKDVELCALPDAIYQALNRVMPRQKEVKL